MAVSHTFPVKGQTERVRFQFFVASTGIPFSGTLTGLTALVSKEDTGFVASSGTLTQIGATSWCFLDLSVSEMTAGSVIVTPSCTNSGVVATGVEIVTTDMSPFVGRYDDQVDLRTERLLLDVHAFLFNRQVNDGASQVIGNPDGSTKVAGVIQAGDTQSIRTKLT